ncbi:hypothetical protein [Streptomyces sp. ST2-7A]|uniref:LppU/SCO3897 family protein n=1 Tax=Streptomyces sp. ST2-7A TaxID=2907214 RepID=UPI001F1DA484|nr:hypothetical protein [Streptomyces sp. ST2-7A]MCE7079246.1 hypothetical protein [Streptomyces sp. ST2-7A]
MTGVEESDHRVGRPTGAGRRGRSGSRSVRSSSSGGQLLLLGIVLAVFALLVAPGLGERGAGSERSDGAAGTPHDSAGTPDDETPGEPGSGAPGAGTRSESGAPDAAPAEDVGGEPPTGEAAEEPPPAATAAPGTAAPPRTPEGEPGTAAGDPTAEAYRRVGPGDCLSNHKTGEEWNSHLPNPVACASDSAFLRVTEVTDRAEACPSGSGRGDWHHTSADGGVTVLCLQREFRVGQCFPARATDGPAGPGRAIPEADLHVWLDCGARKLPEPYNTVLVISDVRPSPDRVPAAVCSRAPGDRGHYWYWVLNGDTELVCATRPAR